MDKIQFAQEGGIAWTTLTEEDLKRSGARADDGEGIVDKIRNINGVNIAFLLRKVNNEPAIKFVKKFGGYPIKTLYEIPLKKVSSYFKKKGKESND